MAMLSRSITIEAPAEHVFAYVDDIRNLARHMSESRSMPMTGSKLKLEIMTPEPTEVGAIYRYSGRMMGLTIDFSETVTNYVAGREKVWRTIGDTRALQHYLGHKNIMHTVRYTELSPERFKNFGKTDAKPRSLVEASGAVLRRTLGGEHGKGAR